MMAIFLVVVALITGYVLGLNRRSENKTQTPEPSSDKEGYSAGYYQAIKDVRKTAKILNDQGEAAPVDKVLTTLLGHAETPSYESNKQLSSNTVQAAPVNRGRFDKPVNASDLLPNITLVVGAVLILASASLFTVWIDEPLVTILVLLIGVGVFFALALKFTNLKIYLPAGLTFLALSIALIPVALSPIPELTMVSKWIITSLAATAMLVYISMHRAIALIPYAATLSFFSLVMSIARGLSDDVFWSFVAVIVVTMILYLIRLKKPLYVAMKYDSPALYSTTWVPAVAAFVSLFYVPGMEVEKLHIILALALAYYLVVWLNSYRYVHELIAKVLGLALLSSITYEHIVPLGMLYVSLSFAIIGLVMVASSLVGWKRANEKRYIFAYEVAWLVAGLATLWYAYAIAIIGSNSYLFASVLALVAMALSLLAAQVSKRVWFNINAVLAVAMAIVSISQWIVVVAGSGSQVYFITACIMAAVGAYMLWIYHKTDKEVSYIAAGAVLFFAFLSVLYLNDSNMTQYRLPELLVAGLAYLMGRRHNWPILYVLSNLLAFSVVIQLVQSLGSDSYGTFMLMGALTGFAVLALVAFLQKENTRKWTLATIVLLTLPMYFTVTNYVSVPNSYDTLKYVALSILMIGTAAAHLLHTRPGAVIGVKIAHELTVFGILILLIEFLRLVDLSGYIHQTIYAHLIGVALVYSSLFVYRESIYKKQAIIRQAIAAVIVSGSMATYALTGAGIGQILFLVEHGALLAVALKFQVRWLVYWASAMLVFAALYILNAPASIMLFLVGAGLIAFVVKSVSKNTRS